MCSAFFSSPVAVRKHHEESNSRKKRVQCSSYCMVQPVHCDGEVKAAGTQSPGYIITRIRKQRRRNECSKLLSVLPPSIDSKIPAKESRHPQSTGLPISVNVTKTIPLQEGPEAHIPSDSMFCQVDNQH